MDNKAIQKRIKQLLVQRIKRNQVPYEKLRRKGLYRHHQGGVVYSAKSVNKMKGGKKSSRKNPWVKFLKEYSKKHPKLYGAALMKEASKAYKKRKKK